jgi:hypothetical protein
MRVRARSAATAHVNKVDEWRAVEDEEANSYLIDVSL